MELLVRSVVVVVVLVVVSAEVAHPEIRTAVRASMVKANSLYFMFPKFAPLESGGCIAFVGPGKTTAFILPRDLQARKCNPFGHEHVAAKW
jgi:hypothetical protein